VFQKKPWLNQVKKEIKILNVKYKNIYFSQTEKMTFLQRFILASIFLSRKKTKRHNLKGGKFEIALTREFFFFPKKRK